MDAISPDRNTVLYPLKFAPILKSKIWGGDAIKSIYRHDAEGRHSIGESWDIAGMEDDDSEVINGFLEGNTLSELTEVYMGDLVGDHVYERFGAEFPLLVKLIDSRQRLSIQVHPDDELAERRHGLRGKNELWYVLHAEPGAYVTAGFGRPTSEDECRALLAGNTLEQSLHHIPVSKGDAIFIPAGCVHSIGAGCLILEIQQASDITYRVFDYGRRDDCGNPRQLHVDMAMEAVDWKNWHNDKLNVPVKLNDISPLIDRPCFSVSLMQLDRPKEYDLAVIDSFVILTCAEGHVTLHFAGDYITLTDAESILIPAEINSLTIVPTVKSLLVETYIK